MKILLKPLMVMLVLAGSTKAQSTDSTGDSAWQNKQAACVAAQTARQPFNGIIAAGNRDAHYFSAKGFADADGKREIKPDTPFLLASVGKIYTQAAIGLLIKDGKVALDASVRTYLPELPEIFGPITISQLLNHRSGVAAMTRPDFADAPAMAGAQNARDLVPVVAGKPLSFAAGSHDGYSNGGYYLLGAVIESASSQSYRDFVSEHIFKALGMRNSGFERTSSSAMSLTRMTGPGQPPADKPQPRMEFPEFKASSAGDAFSSAADLQAFAKALMGDRFLSDASKAAVFSHGKMPWKVRQGGGTVGANTGFWLDPETQSWLVVLSNYDPPGGELMWQALQSVQSGQACKANAPKGPPPPMKQG
jgi:D-alanyl-D-alanine carboxypeptidase